jgi:hypothetical protein
MKMAILEKEVLVTLHNTTIEYYENKGYFIPKYRNKDGVKHVRKGTKILVKVTDLTEGSHVLVTKICDTPHCGEHIPNQKYGMILKQRKNGDGIDRCKKCATMDAWKVKKENIKYNKSLEWYAIENSIEYLLSEFSDKNKKKCHEISFGSNDLYLWNCIKCNSEFSMNVSSRTIGKNNCPYCAGQRVNHTNCLWTTHPEIATLLTNPQRGYEITAGRGEKENFTCGNCGFSDAKIVQNAVKGFSCPKCSDGISYPEKFMMSLLNQLNIIYKTQHKFEWSNNKKYDFFIEDLNVIIETHGIQHYKNSFVGLGSRSLEEEIENDNYKLELAHLNSIDNYIVIDCRESNLDYIRQSIINSKLNEIFHLINRVDWNECHSYAIKSLVKEVSTLWTNGMDNVLEISDILKLSRNTVVKYLKQGSLVNWCNYDSKEARKRNAFIVGKRNKKEIVQLTKNGEYITTWNGIVVASNELKINRVNISKVCEGKNKSSGGFRWMYKEDYEKLYSQQKVI